MPSGIHFTPEQKALLLFNCFDLHRSPEEALNNIFGYLQTSDRPSLGTIKLLWENFLAMDAEQLTAYLLVPGSRGTRKRKYFINPSAPDTICLKRLLAENRIVLIRSLQRQFHEMFLGEYETNIPSVSTVYRTIRRDNTRKLNTVVNIKADPILELAFLKRIECEEADNLIDIDGSIQTEAAFYQRYGWSPKGKQCLQMQFILGMSSFAVHAAYSVDGFLYWKVFEAGEIVTDEHVAAFICSLTAGNFIKENHVGLFDNASNQRTDRVRRTMERAFKGKYYYCSPYSPWLKPIEHGFSMVKKIIRSHDHEEQWRYNPEGLIEFAFNHFRVGTVAGQAASAHFDGYRSNHASYLRSLNI